MRQTAQPASETIDAVEPLTPRAVVELAHRARRGARRAAQLSVAARELLLPVSGRAPQIDAESVAAPCRLELAGDVRAAAAAWAALGCRYEQGVALLGGDAQGVREALGLFESLGAGPAARLARQALRARGVRDIPRGRYRAARNDPLGLTSRERVVLELLRRGLSNRAIAEHLHRSERTTSRRSWPRWAHRARS